MFQICMEVQLENYCWAALGGAGACVSLRDNQSVRPDIYFKSNCWLAIKMGACVMFHKVQIVLAGIATTALDRQSHWITESANS